MSEQFLGLTMLVTLSAPSNAQLRGRVSSVVAGQSLTLRDVYCLNNGHRITEITIRAGDIRDLAQAPEEQSKPVVPLLNPAQNVPRRKTFEDPAILSIGRPPTARAFTPKLTVSAENDPLGIQNLPKISVKGVEREMTPAAVLVDPKSGSNLNGNVDAQVDGGDLDQLHVKKSKSRRAKRNPKGTSNLPGPDAKTTPAVETKRGEGWRQTPLLEPIPSFQPYAALKKGAQRRDNTENGWATEDATDVQDMPEFDFASNLSKFDKKNVFEGIRAEDKTANEDRLVGHNRIGKPGTAGGKNLHHTENVISRLEVTKEKSGSNSEAEDSNGLKAKGSQRDTGSGRNSRRAESRIRKPISRKATGSIDQQAPRALPDHRNPPAKSGFYSGNKRCDVISALQMLNLENIADGEFGLTEDMMTENAARGIAELALTMTENISRRGSSVPFVVVLAGNNKNGARAVAAGRHLRNHGANVVICLLGPETDVLVGLKRQLKVFRSFSGKVLTKTELMEHLKTMDSPVDKVIDGLLGLTISFEELRTGDQAAAYELIEWSNRSGADVIAIDIPTGIDPSSGKLSIIDGRPLYIHPTIVVAMGAPKNGLLQAMNMDEEIIESDAWQIFVADIGIANQGWKKAGTRMRGVIEFERNWTLPMKFRRGAN